LARKLYEPRALKVQYTLGDEQARGWTRLFFAFIGCYFAATAATSIASQLRGGSSKLITGDAVGYYAWLRSAAVDRDLEFDNDYKLLYPPDPLPSEIKQETRAGRTPNKYPPSLALVELPGFAGAHAMAGLLDAPEDGASGPYQLGIAVWLQFFALGGFVALWLAVGQLGGDARLTGLLIGSGLVATNLVNYIAKEPAMAHGAGAALVCFVVAAMVRAKQDIQGIRWLAVAGTFFGLAIAIRPTNAVFAAFLAPIVFPIVGRSLRRGLVFAAPMILLGLFHVALTSLLFGELTVSGYTGESFSGGTRGLVGTLFSSRHGLFVYNPWYATMLFCTAIALRSQKARGVAIGALISFGLLWLANGTWWSWWFGSGFGNRAYVESVPVLIVPVALWLTERRVSTRQIVALASAMTVLAVINLTLWVGYMLHRYPADGQHTIYEAYFWFLS
jgi:hypothetical protein